MTSMKKSDNKNISIANKTWKSIIALILAFIMVFGVIAPVVASAAETSYSSQLGTNKALGSPLLNDNFQYEDWNKWEMVTFGVFISNFVQPMIDDYETAFTNNSRGSAGKGKEALVFGSGTDSVGTKSLEGMLRYAISAQKNGAKPLSVRYITRETGKDNVVEDWKAATTDDLLIYNKAMFSRTPIEGVDGPIIESTKNVSVGDTTVKTIKKSKLCEIAVEGESEGQYEIIFDWANPWDAQVMGAWISRIYNSKYYKQAEKNLIGAIEAEAPLYMDSFGNICVKYDNRFIVVIPSAVNCHIYKTERYNLINSIILNDSYVNMTPSVLTNSLFINDQGGIDTTNDKLKDGAVLVYFDTNSLFANYADNVDADDSKLNWGSALLKILNSTLKGDASQNEMGINISIIGAARAEGIFNSRYGDSSMSKLSQDIATCGPLIAATYPTNYRKAINTMLYTDKGEFPLFGDPTYVSIGKSTVSSTTGPLGAILVHSMMSYIDGSSSAQSGVDIKPQKELRAELSRLNTQKEVAEWFWFANGKDSEVSTLMINSLVSGLNGAVVCKDSADFGQVKAKASTLKLSELNKYMQYQRGKTHLSISESVDTDSDSLSRILKINGHNSSMAGAMNALNIKEGTEFALWTRQVYMTYLKWFGIIGSREHNFNTVIFKETSDILKVKPEEITDGAYKTKEEKEAEVLDYTYLMLDPERGREYRSNILMNWLSDFVYRTYHNMVYGDSISYDNGTSGTRIASGFLHMESYSENFMTSAFLENFGKIAIIGIGIMILAIIVTCILFNKSFAWLGVSVVMIINIIIMIPMVGEITPYVANNIVQNMFSDKMTYWAMAESIANFKLEQDLAETNESGVSSGLTTSDFIKMLNIVYLDRSIMLKTDISKKITEDTNGIVEDIQNLQSARWLLPTIIRQFSASDGSANYVYQQLGDVYDNVSNMYWVYKPEDKLNVISDKANITNDAVPIDTSLSNKQALYEAYKDTSMDATRAQDDEYLERTVNTLDIDYGDDPYLDFTWNSVSRAKPDEQLPHTGFYLIEGINVLDPMGDFQAVIDNPENYVVSTDAFIEAANHLEQVADAYKPTKEGAKTEYGYLWTTENLMHYFYMAVKDQFESGKTVAGLAGDLQGFYQVSPETGYEERNSFMHYRTSGDVRDIADMEELFTNVIPYMYTIQLLAGGSDGESGILKDSKMNQYELYSEMNESWLFRCNWATKLMEGRDLIRPTTVRDFNGNKYQVENPMLPSCYPEERPMVFSEAEQKAKGISDADLTVPEIKIIRVNKEIEKKWTLLLNYVNSADISSEVFYRQMATDALLEFNKEFSPDRLINGSKALYPTSLDLRNISFDSVMKLLMINSTRDASLIYGDTMKQVVETSDFLSMILLLLSAFVCCTVIPLFRNIILGLLFYVGLWAVICNILAGGQTKMKMSAAYVLDNLVFLTLTVCYYGIFALLINTSTPDEVLSASTININAGPPTWQFLIILVASILYIMYCFRMISFVIKNFRDLGFEVYAAWTGSLVDKLQGGISNITGKFGEASSKFTGFSIGGNSRKGMKSDSAKSGDNGSIDGTVEAVSEDEKSKKRKSERKSEIEKQYEQGNSGFTSEYSDDTFSTGNGNVFDDEIKKGQSIAKEEHRSQKKQQNGTNKHNTSQKRSEK